MPQKPTSKSVFGPIVLFMSALIGVLSATARASDISETYLWKPVRIGAGGWMRGMVVHPTDPNVRYIRGDVSNAYRWDASSSAWIPMEIASAMPAAVSAAPSSGGPGALAVDPSNANVVYAAWEFQRSADGGSTYPSIAINIYKSVDGGITFTAGNLALSDAPGTQICNETRGESLAVDPNNGQVVLYGSPASGLWESTDGGAHWSAVSGSGAPAPNSGVINPRFDGSAGTTLVAGQQVSRRIYATVSAGSVLMSDDGGVSWSNISSGQAIDGNAAASLVDVNGNFVVAASNASTLWSYTRAGAWSSASCPFVPNGVAVDSGNANRIFIVDGGTQVARSTDKGATWTNFGYSKVSSNVLWLQPSPFRPSPHYISNGGIYIDPSGNLWVPCGNEGCITATPNDKTDSPANPMPWSTSAIGIEEMVARAAVIPPGGNPVLTFDDETSFYAAFPDSFNAQHFDIDLWANGNNGLSSNGDIAYCPNQPSFVVLSSANVFAGNPSTYNYGSYSSDGGKNWSVFGSIASGKHPGVLYGGLIAVGARASGHLIDSPGADSIVWIPTNISSPNAYAPFYSSDGGNTWKQTHSFDSTSGSSSSGGYTMLPKQWGMWNPSLSQHLLEADCVNPGTFYWNSPIGGFWKSVDGGTTWSQTSGSVAGQLGGPMHHGQLRSVPGASGDLWLVDGREGSTNANNSPSSHGLWHTADGGTTFSYISGFDFAISLALGKAQNQGGYPTIYVYGKRTGDAQFGVFRSVDQASTWDRIAYYPTGLIDTPAFMAASWDVFGLIYVGFLGNSYVYGAPVSLNLDSSLNGYLNVPFTYGVASAGATSFSASNLPAGLSIDPSSGVISGTPTVSGAFPISVSANNGVTSQSILTIYPAASRLSDISTRSEVKTGGNIQIGGFVIRGTSAKTVLIRASGPSLGLAPFNLSGVLADPSLSLYAGQTLLDQSVGWNSALTQTFSQVGAFVWPNGSKDSALLETLAPGAYTAEVSGLSSDAGVALVEVYDADSASSSTLSNISTRSFVGTSGNIEIGGFVIAGSAPMRVVIRASGPSLGLSPFNLSGVLPDPVLTLYSGQTPIDRNSGWNPVLARDFSDVGAFTWAQNSRDAALVEILPPGAYTVEVSGESSDAGIGLIEIYDER